MAEYARLRRNLVESLTKEGALREPRVAEAFETVPRHLFVPGEKPAEVYRNRAFITKQIDGVPASSSSEPSIMAIMLEQLGVEPGQRMLEIGAGTGYNAALLAHLTGPEGYVTTVDIDADVADGARSHLQAAGAGRVDVVYADGGRGHAAGGPYDRIIATASCWQVPRPWMDQLHDGGLLVLPFRLNGAHVSLALRKRGDELAGTRAAMCGFMPLRGPFGPAFEAAAEGIHLSADGPVDAETWRELAETLKEPRSARFSMPALLDDDNSPLYYLAFQEKPIIRVLRHFDKWGPIPFALVASGGSAMALPWARPPEHGLAAFGTDDALAFVREALARWQDEGQPDLRHLRVRVRPSRARVGALPQRSDGRYRLRRGDHAYEFWFETP